MLYLNHKWVFDITTDVVHLNGRNAYGCLTNIVINKLLVTLKIIKHYTVWRISSSYDESSVC
jgi:hypothetical protein